MGKEFHHLGFWESPVLGKPFVWEITQRIISSGGVI
jgi:hypothetical protein